MEEMIKISALCITVCLISSIIGQGSRAMSSVLIIAAGVVILVFALQKGVMLWNRLKTLISASGIDGRLIIPMVKVLGISLCAKTASELCRDIGSRWAASNIEIFAVLSSVICMLPLLEEVLKLVGSI